MVDKVIWCNRGWFTPYYGFCPNERAWKRAMKLMNAEGEAYPTSDARCVSFEKNDRLKMIVTVGHHIDKRRDPPGVMGLLVHEAMHIWRHIRENIGETEPSTEFEAYAMQTISTELWTAYHDTRAKLWR